MLNDDSVDHEYLPITGLPEFCDLSGKLLFGADSPVVKEKRLSTVQCISGTGSNHLAALFLSRFYKFNGEKKAFISQPTWGASDCFFCRSMYLRPPSQPLQHLPQCWH